MHVCCRILIVMIVMCYNPVFAHGEDNPGPHGGFIRMPGAFHTEVIPHKNGIEIMLLDINFEHPIVKDSSVKAFIKSGKKTITLKCEVKADSFFCPVPHDLLQKSGTLELLPERHFALGAKVSYELPLHRMKVS